MLIWYPDFCPPGQPCALEIAPDWSAVNAFMRACPHHQSLRDGGQSDNEVFSAMLQSCRVKEIARWEAKLELGLSKDHPGVAYRVEADGSITIMTGASEFVLAGIRSRIARAIATVPRPLGTSLISIE